VVPRRAAAGEVLDDHQLMLCRALAERQLITVCESEPELRAALAAPPPPPEAGRAPALPAELLPAVAALLASIAAQRSRRDPSRSPQSA
jgi:UDP-N-acetylglucosamine transferase subunit ALG13